ncbi:MAG: TonB-dependent vitamin B12 receptor [Candidatus Parabeggiatoa sp. nov. 2]|nr:MAG: TonB-dependent vitamin B12 receptor [Beggiatoa sp. 4572_84]RKZ57586.1 MAG: TonB-dependent vitamin B12 receptor [Gammaproteobacteria bacterium]HEC83710.1 TonB-dependent vitamin B12 receptor [Thioploca sp.]
MNVKRKLTLKKFLRFSSLVFILFFYPLSNAQEQRLPEVVVTATRTAQTVDDSLASVTVITREDIDNSQALTVPDLLRGVPGLDVTTSGGLGKSASVFLRGTESDHVLVLMDGVKVGSATLGTAAFQHLPLAQIERIEIVRGPRSSLYGSEAIGGVIQIFTRQGKGKKPSITFSGGYGADNTYQVTGGVLGSTKTSWYNLSAGYLQTDGFNDCRGSESGGCFTIEPDDDGYDNTSYSVRLGHRFGESLSLEAFALRTEGHSEYDSSFDNEADILQQVIGFKADYAVSDSWLMNLNVGQSLDETDNFGNNAPNSFFNTTRTTGSFQSNFLFSNENTLTIGYDYQKDEVESSTAYTVDSLDNQGIFAQYQTQYGQADLIVGLRQDDNDQFGKHTTGNVGLGYALSPKTRFVLSYGTAFKAPSFNELYFPNFGNPNLVPEESESIEMSFMGTQPLYKWSLNTYYTKVDKLIATNFDAATGNYFADNINNAKITGIDGALNWRKGGWEFNTTFSWLKPEDGTTGNLLPRRAEKSLMLELAEKRGPARLGLSWLTQSHRYDDTANTQRLGSYGILNATSEYNFNKHWALRIRVENALDEEYETARFYNTSGRFWFVSLHYQH